MKHFKPIAIILMAFTVSACAYNFYSDISFFKPYKPDEKRELVDATFNIESGGYINGVKIYEMSEKKSSYGLECNYYEDLGAIKLPIDDPQSQVVKTKIPANSKIGIYYYVYHGKYPSSTYNRVSYSSCQLSITFDTDSKSSYEVDLVGRSSSGGCAIGVSNIDSETGNKDREKTTDKYYYGCFKPSAKFK